MFSRLYGMNMQPVLFALFLAGQVLATVLPERRSTAVCYPGEVQNLFCYTRPQGTPQNVNPDDVLWVAKALREYGTGLQEKVDEDGNPVLDSDGISVEEPVYRFLNMTTGTAPECGEWTIYAADSVLVTAKLMTSKKSGLVFYGDIADTIDGGDGSTEARKSDAVISCGADGGSREVHANMTHEAYKQYQSLYDSGVYAVTDIVVKVVANLDWKAAQREADD